ncbi:hypothetical protein [Bacillus bombysepticus]|uniref:hypothetical protein n=1 Tax=Bacillus bombysepticus TaxID=658666 RepID=UPI00207AD5DF|nr:hypothetical protein [Bacillus bombysepticus]USL11053.1 hypothetical protein LIT24_29515 [Bacillus bombysepticus]
MGKFNHLNPVLSSSIKKVIEQQKRKVRSDKLHDIKIPVDEPVDMILRRESRRYWNGSKTALGTEILLFGLEQVLVYPDVTYTDKTYTVHCKVNHETYQKIGDYAAVWKCSVRKAAHRIFVEAYKKKQLGGVTDGEI